MKHTNTDFARNDLTLAAAGALLLASAGCNLALDTGEATLELRVEGTPADEAAIGDQDVVVGAVATIEEIYLQPAGEDGERVVLRAEPITTSLFDLNETAELLRETAAVPPGEYSQLRFVISGAYLDVSGQGIYATEGYDRVPADRDVIGMLKTPSFDTSGLKVELEDGLFEPGDDTTLVARFDVAESFGHQAGASGSWVMHPVINMARAEETGSVELILDAEAIVDLVQGPIHIDVRDVDGYVEASLDLEVDVSGRLYEAQLLDVITGEGPFTFELSAQSATGASVSIVTEPALGEVALSKGQDLRLELTAVAATP